VARQPVVSPAVGRLASRRGSALRSLRPAILNHQALHPRRSVWCALVRAPGQLPLLFDECVEPAAERLQVRRWPNLLPTHP